MARRVCFEASGRINISGFAGQCDIPNILVAEASTDVKYVCSKIYMVFRVQFDGTILSFYISMQGKFQNIDLTRVYTKMGSCDMYLF